MLFSAKAYAKINLTLDVTGKRTDGYHLLRMVMQTVSLCDRIMLEDAEGLRILCDQPGLSLGENNTLFRAARAFFRAAGMEETGAAFTVQKRIPWQAGLGGGSADAAAVLVLLNRKYRTGFSKKDLCRIGLSVGADVPFCVVGGTALAEGIGERIHSLPPFPDCHIVICKPSAGNDTAKAYARLDAAGGIGTDYTGPFLSALDTGDLSCIAPRAGNAFELAVPAGESKKIKETMRSHGALGACLSGSGSAVYGIFDSEGQAAECRAAFSADFSDVFLCKPVSFF